MQPIQNLCRILMHIDKISDDLVRRTDEISDLLANYDMDAPVVDELLQSVNERNDVVQELNSCQHDMNEAVGSLDNEELNLQIVRELQEQIAQKLSSIIARDQVNNKKIVQYRDLIANQIAEVLKGKKMTRAYNLVPHQKAIFVDMTNRK